MKIGIVTTWFERGAAYVSKQFKEVLEHEHDVFIYARGGEEFAIGDPNWDGDYVTWAKKPLTFAFTDINLENFRAWLLDNEIELVLFNEQKIWAPVLLCRDLNIKTGAYIDYYTEEIVPCFGVYDFLICNTERHRSVFEHHPQCLFFPWGTDTNLYQPQEHKGDEGGVKFFHSAGMSPYRKGTDLLIKAFLRLEGEAKLIVHSQVDLKTAFPQLAADIDKLLSSGSLELHEYTVSAPGLYHLGDVYVYPSRLDGIGLTILEAASAGLPIIVPDNGPMNEFVGEHGENGKAVNIEKLWSRWDGYYWPQCEVALDSLHESLKFYVDNQNNIQNLKAQAREYAVRHFSWENNTKKIADTLSNVRVLTAEEVNEAKKSALKYDDKMLKKHAKSKKQLFVDKLEEDYPTLYRILKRTK
ncbi:glycosyltransferase family 4 protein [Colwellia sp. D2M02]|uniref:glycosyltransferase family 4 protein n=1 Tax=Colwellia sp. D2M02 TaxID=2841562 RepID=UPI001C09E346|nr:glycosyltransferase family 4 protein [Colwellia sp. D2M02]MBU2894679.1 glycosyltransferase family 4 protein [Colwellia sp. D2M02]